MTQGSTILDLAATLRHAAAQGIPGDRFPSTRELVARHRVSPVTVSRALAVLASEGVVTTRPGAGTFVARPVGPPASRIDDFCWQTISLGGHVIDDSGMRALLETAMSPSDISLAGGYPHPSLTAARPLSAALVRAARRPDAWERPPLHGLAPLRRWFAESVGAGISPDDVVITSGGQSALSAALRATSPAGASVLVESPAYPGVLAAARAAGLRPVPVPVDAGGMRTDLLAEAFTISGARAVYCQPTYQNPTGSVLGADRRLELLDAAAAAGAFVIEDDWARWVAHRGQAPPPLAAQDIDGRVIHISSLTKAAAPSLRIGALAARGPIAERLRALRLVDDFFVTRPLQEAALELLGSPAWHRHLATLAVALRERHDALLAALTRHLPGAHVTCTPAGGFYAWIRLPEGCEDLATVAAARQAGVLVGAGRPFFAAEAPGAYVRLSVVAAARTADIEEGVRRLASALR